MTETKPIAIPIDSSIKLSKEECPIIEKEKE